MSQEKVNAYKEAKATRKEDALKQRNKKMLTKWIARAVIALVIIGLGVGVYFTIKNNSTSGDDAWKATDLQIKDYVNIENATQEGEEETEAEGEEGEKETTAKDESTTAGDESGSTDGTTEGVTSSGAAN